MFFGELYGLFLALEILGDPSEFQDIRSVIIYTDNQSAIRNAHNPQTRSGQYMLAKIIRLLGILDRQVEIHWISVHQGVSGNEEADTVAKKATGWREKGQGPPAPTSPDLKPLITAQRAVHRFHTMKKWAQEWNLTLPKNNAKQVGRLARKLEPIPNRRVLDRYGALDKARSAMLIQMRIGHASLNGFLAAIGIIPPHESQCPCGYGIETRDHVLLHCGLFRELREIVLWAYDGETDINVLLGDPTRLASITSFIMQTGRLA